MSFNIFSWWSDGSGIDWKHGWTVSQNNRVNLVLVFLQADSTILVKLVLLLESTISAQANYGGDLPQKN